MSRTDDILNLPAYRRRKLRLGKPRGKYNPKETRSFSEEELLSFLQERNYRTRKALRGGRKSGEPSGNDYDKAFGNWGEALKLAFPVKDRDVDEQERANYMAKAIAFHGLWTFRQYVAARKRGNGGVPSSYEKLGIWDGVVPSIYELKKSWGRNGLNMDKAIDHYGSKKKMDSLFMRKSNEKRKRS